MKTQHRDQVSADASLMSKILQYQQSRQCWGHDYQPYSVNSLCFSQLQSPTPVIRYFMT